MTTYFIGDVHGCYDELIELLDKIAFNQTHDRLFFVGDLINRGAKSLEVLRYVKSLGGSAEVVLGNHDVSLLAYAYGVYHGRNSDFPDILKAKDAPLLLDWLSKRPLMLVDDAERYVVSHAGIPPRWSLKKARKHAKKAEKQLRSSDAKDFIRYAYEKHSDKWQKNGTAFDKFRYRLNGFTRMRYCLDDGEFDFANKTPPNQKTRGLTPWYSLRKRLQNDGDTRLIFGHWAALGYHVDDNAICIDSGCAWGGELTAIALTDGGIKRYSVPSRNSK